MTFNMKYDIIKDYLPTGTKRRPGGKLKKIVFDVAHDTGNPGSTAKGNIHYYRNSPTIAASAHLFVDDHEIRECIPALLESPERAYHVLYNVTKDNQLYGADANDSAIGVELCYGKGIDSEEAYKRYVWVHAYICYKFDLNPQRDIVGHDTLDPKRKIDPTNALKYMGRTYNRFIMDVVAEYKACTGQVATPSIQAPTAKDGETHTVVAGDTLWSISQKYDTTVAALKVLNPEIDVYAIQVGQVLLIKAKEGTSTQQQTANYHTIAKGDTLSALATKYNTTVADIERLNPGINPTALQIGQKVLVGYTDHTVTVSDSNVDSELAEYLKYDPIRPYPGTPLKIGASTNKTKNVEAVQRALGLSVDGTFGAKTEEAVKAYQSKFSFLGVDGIVGYNTWNVMF